MSTPHYQVGLGPKVLSRARKIFAPLLLITVILIIWAIHQGVTSGDFDKVFIAPFRQFGQDLDNTLKASPTPTSSASATPISSPNNQKTIYNTPTQVKPAQPVSNCIRKNIREGEFASNKCYSPQDFEDLEYYLARYGGAKFDLSAAEGSMRITCNCRVQQECDFFKDSCERDKAQKSQAESDIAKYRSIILGIIAKGK